MVRKVYTLCNMADLLDNTSMIPTRIKTIVSQFLCICLLVLSPAWGAQEKLTFEQASAYYTFEVIRHVTWPDDDAIKEFSVGAIGLDAKVREAFEQKKTSLLRGKTVKIEYINDGDFEPGRYSVIFIGYKRRGLNDEIFKRNPRALIISDGKVDRKYQLVSLISSRKNISVTLNRDNLSDRGFWASTGLLGIAGTKEELSAQLRVSDLRLKDLADQVKSREKVLEELNSDLKIKSSMLADATTALTNNQRILDNTRNQLAALLDEVDSSREEVRNNQQDIERQKQLIDEKQKEVSIKEEEIERLQVDIVKNQMILTQQSDRLSQQGAMIKTKEETIVAQRTMILVAILVSLVFFAMIYFLLKVNKLRRESNHKLEKLNSQLYELATTDGLTKLLNRRHFMAMARKEFVRQRRKNTCSSLLMVDIDGFKQVNDTFGHAMGDEVIIAVARVLESDLRQYDYLGRFGGEEYVMLLPDCDVNAAYEIAQRLCKDVSEREISFQKDSISVTVSIGISELTSDDIEVESAFHRADSALYQAKDKGKNCVVIFSDD